MPYPKQMSILEHAKAAGRIRQTGALLETLVDTFASCYPMSHPLVRALTRTEKAMRRARSHAEDLLYREHGDLMANIGFPHCSDEALHRLHDLARDIESPQRAGPS